MRNFLIVLVVVVVLGLLAVKKSRAKNDDEND
jgi:Tfp pilus assembly protein PilX